MVIQAVIIAIYGLVLRPRTNVHRQAVVLFVILQMGVAYTATALGYSGKATALATLSGWILLLLLLGRAGRPRLVVSAIAMFALAGLFGYRATSDWMHRKPEEARDIDVEFFTVADDVAWRDAELRSTLPPPWTIVEETTAAADGKTLTVYRLAATDVDAESRPQAIKNARDWAKQNLHLRDTEIMAFSLEPDGSQLSGYVLTRPPILTSKDVKSAAVQPPDSTNFRGIAVTFTSAAEEKLRHLHESQPNLRIVLLIEGGIGFGPVSAPQPSGHLPVIFRWGRDVSEDEAKFFVGALQGNAWTVDPRGDMQAPPAQLKSPR
jgi:hypothetical protein